MRWITYYPGFENLDISQVDLIQTWVSYFYCTKKVKFLYISFYYLWHWIALNILKVITIGYWKCNKLCLLMYKLYSLENKWDFCAKCLEFKCYVAYQKIKLKTLTQKIVFLTLNFLFIFFIQKKCDTVRVLRKSEVTLKNVAEFYRNCL